MREEALTSMEIKPLQAMDLTTLKSVLKDLRQKIVPSRFEKAQQPDKKTLQLGFRTLERLVWIEISWDADNPRLVEIDPPSNIGSKSTLAKQLQNGLRQMALVGLNQDGFERIVEISFAFRPNESSQKTLIVELMGRHSNLLLLNQEKEVITLGRQIKKNQSRLRPIGTGDIYVAPPPLRGIKPNHEESFESWKERLSLLPITLEKALQQSYQGISPSLALQLTGEDKHLANETCKLPVTKIPTKKWHEIFKRWLSWLNTIELENYFINLNGPTDYQVWSINSECSESRESISIFLGKYYTSKVLKNKFIGLYKILLKRLIKTKRNEERSLYEQENLLSRVSQHKNLQEKADKILSLHNPSKELIKEAQSLYNKAKKIRRSEAMLKERVNYHKERLFFINESELFINHLRYQFYYQKFEDINVILEIEEEFNEYLFPAKQKEKKRKKDFQSNKKEFLEIVSPNGLTIQIGRNHRQNELISLKRSRKGDLWFHAQECPGSHVVLKSSCEKAEESDIKMASDFAAFFSRAKGNTKVPVVMVPTNKLHKLKGGVAGAVNHRGGEVLWGNPLNAKRLFEVNSSNAHDALSSSSM